MCLTYFLFKTKVSNEDREEGKGPFPAVIQQYVSKPKLFLQTKRKFDIRIYVVVFDLEPLTACIYNEGLVRICSIQYEQPNDANRKIPHIHLTNSKINPSTDSTKFACEDSKLPTLNKENQGEKQKNKFLLSEWLSCCDIEVESFWTQVHKSVAATLMSIQPACTLMYNTCFPRSDRQQNSLSRSFQILGFDFIPDTSNKIWLLEVNNNPSLNLDTLVDKQIKMPLLASLFDKLSSGPEHVNNTSFRAVKFDKGLSDDCKLLRMIYMHLCGMFWTPPVFLLQILVQKSPNIFLCS